MFTFKRAIPRLAMAAMFLAALASCNKNNPAKSVYPRKVNMIIDTDIGNSADDLLAIQAAFAFQSKGWCEIKGLISSRGTEKVQKLADCILHYYNADNIPLGINRSDKSFFEIVPFFSEAGQQYTGFWLRFRAGYEVFSGKGI